MPTTVIIPALNEEKTIGDIVKTFASHPQTSNVYVGIDSWTTDGTAEAVWDNGGCAVRTDQHGKGQVVSAMRKFPIKVTPRMIMCDGDYTGLTRAHIELLLHKSRGLTIGVPDYPDMQLPEHVINAWPMISGFRAFPWWLFPDDDAHGYLVDTQINVRAVRSNIPINQVWMNDLKSPFQWPLPPARLETIRREREWGMSHGVL